MSQKSVPIADVGTPTGWSTPVWSQTDELKPGDPDYTVSSVNPAGDAFVVQLGAFGVPPPSARPFRVNVRARATAGGALLVALLQSSTVIASRVLSPGTTFDDYPFDLTEAEIGRIDYTAGTTNFKLEGKAYAPTPRVCDCTGCVDGAPRDLLLTVSGIVNGTCTHCSDYNGTFTLRYRGSCVWATDESGTCGAGPTFLPRYVVYKSGPWLMSIGGTLSDGPIAYYEGGYPTDCTLVGGATLASFGDSCSNYPNGISWKAIGGTVGVCTACCSVASVPNIVFVTFSSCSPSTCDAASVAFSYRSGTNDWRPDSNPLCGTFASNTRLVCDAGTFKYGDSSLVSLTTTSCGPLQLTGTGCPAPGGGTCSLTITT